MTKELQEKILKFLNKNIGEKLSVADIWRELRVDDKELSYQKIQTNIQWLQYQQNTPIKTERKGHHKLVWVEK